MRIRSFVLAAAAALGLLVVVPAAPAFAINQVSCTSQTVKLDIDHGNGAGTGRCFANSGTTGVNIGGVYRASAGNNRTTINFEVNGRYYTKTLDRGLHINFAGNVRVYEVRIW
ncbi:beta/gamma crystallin domain-containing protein [Pseudonocardia sp. ICBG1293]|uniref:beta/gamma crystallin domain-containing protein n=1 Tax=Pseudonocardia sp. ICBG1293 TaxID=2844382 RepID=UPI001CCB4DF3|nr:beta/gamma crystallin domain-containing protein [Pseudonocardia sp. ICBG1293]